MQLERCDVCCGSNIAITYAKRCVVKYNDLEPMIEEDNDFHEDSAPWCVDCLGLEQPDEGNGDGQRIITTDVLWYQVDELVEIRRDNGDCPDVGLIVERVVQCSSNEDDYGFYNVLVGNKIETAFHDCLRTDRIRA